MIYLETGQKLRLKINVAFLLKGSIGFVSGIETNHSTSGLNIKFLNVNFGSDIISLEDITQMKFDTYFEKVEETKKLESMSDDEIIKTLSKEFKNMLNETKMSTFIDIPRFTLPESVQSILERITKPEIKGESMKNILIPKYVGYKGTEIILVWKDGSKTKAKPLKDSIDEVSFLYGFLIAYYKKVHEDLDREKLYQKLRRSIYEKDMGYQLGYLMAIFEENCGLSKRKIDQFLGKYVLIIAPFEIDLKDLKRTYKVDKKFLL